jgi:hypothetical protein
MTTPNIPSADPASSGTLTGLLETAFKKTLQKLEGQLPCEVLSYDRSSNRATVRPLLDVVHMSGQLTSRGQYASIPVLALGGGGYTVTFPLVRGDKGWIEASDRDISLFLQAMDNAPPGSFRMHVFSAGRFIPDSFAAYSFNAADDSSSMVMQSYDGTVKITLDPAKIRIIAPTVEVTASVAASVTTADATVTATDSITMTCGASSISITPAALAITSPAPTINSTGASGPEFTGPPVKMPDAVINGVTQSTHNHGNVTNGPDSTDGPKN